MRSELRHFVSSNTPLFMATGVFDLALAFVLAVAFAEAFGSPANPLDQTTIKTYRKEKD